MKNVEAPIREVLHTELQRCSPESWYKSKCMACEDGAFLMFRDRETGRLAEFDRCISCGQPIRYLDIEGLRQADGVGTK